MGRRRLGRYGNADMIVETFHYAPLTASTVRFEPGERHFISGGPCLGVLFVAGSWKLHSSGIESGPDDLGWHAPNPDGTWPREFWNSYDANDYCEAGPSGVEWVCLEPNETGPREVAYQSISGPLTVEAGWGALVADGSAAIGNPVAPPVQTPTFEKNYENKVFRVYKTPIELEGGLGVPINYFRSSDSDRVIMGTAQILLVR